VRARSKMGWTIDAGGSTAACVEAAGSGVGVTKGSGALITVSFALVTSVIAALAVLLISVPAL
jgi:hypothetical protein